jgi:hypothetical protein
MEKKPVRKQPAPRKEYIVVDGNTVFTVKGRAKSGDTVYLTAQEAKKLTGKVEPVA